MNPVDRAVWYIERHFGGELSLDEVAEAAGVSRFHMTRLFGLAAGRPIMRYVRSRRLTVAAQTLAAGAPDILAVALEAGYGSHEAFTRAFREQFGLTPEALRSRGSLSGIELVEALGMGKTPDITLEPPRYENARAYLIAGLTARYSRQSKAGIPAQWQRFLPHLGRVPGQVGKVAYGVCYNTDDTGQFDYLCGVEVADFARLPADLARIRVPEHRYVVFTHRGHISTINGTWEAVCSRWLPASGHKMADAPDFERYGEEFDSATGTGGLEIWIPIGE